MFSSGEKRTEFFEIKTFENGYVGIRCNGIIAHRVRCGTCINMIYLFYGHSPTTNAILHSIVADFSSRHRFQRGQIWVYGFCSIGTRYMFFFKPSLCFDDQNNIILWPTKVEKIIIYLKYNLPRTNDKTIQGLRTHRKKRHQRR